MLRSLLAACVVCLMTACGPDFTGTYSGTLGSVGTCSDGSSINNSGAASWVLSEGGGGVQATFQGSCSPISGTTVGNIWTMAGKTCLPYVSGGDTVNTTLQDGSGTLTGNVLDIVAHLTASDSVGSCSVTLSGSLTR